MAKRGIVQVGQSNHKTGYSYNRPDWSRGDPRMYQFKQDQTTVLATQAMDSPDAKAGTPFTASLWYLVRDYLIPRFPGVDFCILPLAYGGTSFHADWHAPHPPDYASGGARYNFAIAQMNAFLAAEAGNTIDVVILQNGEEEATAIGANQGYYATLSDYDAYTRYVTEFVAGITSSVSGGTRTWPFLIGAVPPDIIWGPTTPVLPNYPSGIGPSADGADHHNSAYVPIFQACQDMPNVISNCGFVDPLNPTKIQCHATTAVDGNGTVWLNSSEYPIHYDQPALREMAHRQFKQYMKLKGYGTIISAAYGVATAAGIPSNIWMEAPDILAFYVDDAPIKHGSVQTVSPARTEPYSLSNPIQVTNPATSALEWGFIIGDTKTAMRFSDQPSPNYVDTVALHLLSGYTITGGVTITAVYFRDEVLDLGISYVSSVQTRLSQFRHTVYLKLSAQLTNGVAYTVSCTGNPFPSFTFTYNDKKIRAGGIKVSQTGVRPDDTFKKVYLASRIPSAPNNGVVDFAGTYGITTAQIINAATGATVATVNVNLRRAWNQLEPDFYSTTGIDVADTSVGVPIASIAKGGPGANTVTTSVPHGFANGDDVRFHGISGMTQIEGIGSANLWVASTISNVTSTTFTLDSITTTGFGTFSTTPAFSTALGGTSNVVHKCFNTNRAGTNVYQLDLSTFTTPGDYFVYIPGYGISDPFHVATNAYAIFTGYLHQGIYNLRLGCDVIKDPGWQRPLALVDGVNGCAIYKSNLPGIFSNEAQQLIAPAGSSSVLSGFGGYSDEGVITISNMVWSASPNIVTVTTSAPHGIPIGSTYPIAIINCLPAGYNFASSTSAGVYTAATITDATHFTYPVASNPGTVTQIGTLRTGFLTSTRATGYRASVQDAGDNDDLACDHMICQTTLAFTLNNIPAASRFTPFVVQKCTELLNATLYAGTDDKPPLFHEVCFYADNYRVAQLGNGDIPGGIGFPQIPNASQINWSFEPIHMNRGFSPFGNRASQLTHAFQYAPDHFSTMAYAALAAQIALLCQGYGLTTLSSTWQTSAVNAYNRARDLIYDFTKRDAYYITQLNFPARMGWTTAQYHEAMGTLSLRAIIQQYNAAGALYRLLGSPSNQTLYGNFIDGPCTVSNPVIGTGSGGSGYAVGDLIVMDKGTPVTTISRTIVRVTGIGGGGAVTTAVIYANGEYMPGAPPTTPFTQLSTTGSGSGVSFQTMTIAGVYTSMQSVVNSSTSVALGGYDYSVTPLNNTTAKNYFVTRNVGNSVTNSAFATSATTAFNTAISSSLSGGNTVPNQPMDLILAHLYVVLQNPGAPANYSSVFLQAMSGHIQWVSGANLPGLCMTLRAGIRSTNAILHEDQDKMGVPVPPGIVPYSYSAWALAVPSTADGALNYFSDNITGTNETLPQKGSTKLWNNWRFGESYWEYKPEGRANVSVGEFTMAQQIQNLCIALYAHGWDGNA